MSADKFDEGLTIRREVMGEDYVDRTFENATDFDREFQEHFITGLGWGEIWSRDGLTRKQRSLICLGMLGAMQRIPEFKSHVSGALRNGLTMDEIREALIQISGYCGMPAGIGCFRAAREVFETMREANEL